METQHRAYYHYFNGDSLDTKAIDGNNQKFASYQTGPQVILSFYAM